MQHWLIKIHLVSIYRPRVPGVADYVSSRSSLPLAHPFKKTPLLKSANDIAH